MKAGDLVRRKEGKDIGEIGLFLEWKTFDKKTNPYECPVIMWMGDDKASTIQASLVEVISESR
jgi:hypothetical protein